MLIHPLQEMIMEDRKVFLRADLNVPLEGSTITEDSRLHALLPTLNYCLQHDARLVVASHLGTPRSAADTRCSLEPVGAWLAEQLNMEVLFTDEPAGDGARRVVQNLREGQLVLLENLRFNPGEKSGDETFARALAEGIDVYVGEAFSACHRREASVVALPTLVAERAMGFLLQAEIEALSRLVVKPAHPYVALFGGSRPSEKLPILESLLGRADCILVGGALAVCLLRAEGRDTGASLQEPSQIIAAAETLRNARLRGVELLLPVDLRVCSDPEAPGEVRVIEGSVPPGHHVVDIGPRTEELFASRIERARTLFWNGPLGIYEEELFSGGTQRIARALAASRGYTVVAGSDTVAAARATGVVSRIDHVSAGGAAALEYLKGRPLPGIAALES